MNHRVKLGLCARKFLILVNLLFGQNQSKQRKCMYNRILLHLPPYYLLIGKSETT